MHSGDSLRLHGRTDPRGSRPVALELDGRMLKVVWTRVRHDLAIAWDRVDRLAEIRLYYELRLEDGRQLVCYQELNHLGWFLEPDAVMGPAADAALAEIARKNAADQAWFRQQRTEAQAKEDRRLARLSRPDGKLSAPSTAP